MQKGDALAHADQPVARARGAGPGRPVVDDLDGQRLVAVLDEHAAWVRVGMANDVRDSFLDDPVRGPVDAAWALSAATVTILAGGPSDHHLGGAIILKPAHRSQPALELTMIGLYR